MQDTSPSPNARETESNGSWNGHSRHGPSEVVGSTAPPLGPAAFTGSSRLVVVMMCLTVGLVLGSGSVLFIALPNVALELGASQTDAVWLAGIYPLVIAALLMPCGALIDRYGRKSGCMLGLMLMAGAFPAAGLADGPGLAIALLGLAGVGGALVFPATLATITAIMPKERRGTAVGMWSASMLAGGAIGSAGGGVLAQTVIVPWIFAAPGIVALLLLAGTLAWVPESRDDRHVALDIDGAFLSAIGVGLFVFGMIEAPTKGWTDPLTLSALVGLGFLVLFVRWELRTPEPMLDVRLLRQGRFGMGSLVNVLSWFLGYGMFFLAVQYRVFTLGYGPLQAGASLVSLMVLTIPLGALGPRLARRHGARIVMVGGLALMAAGSVGVAFAATTHTYHWVALAEVFAFGGLGLVGGPATEAIVDGLPASHQGVASAVNDTTRELGVAVGVAMMGSLFNLAYRNEVSDNPYGLPVAAAEATTDSAAAGLQIAASLPENIQGLQTGLVQDAVASGLTLAVVVAAVVIALGAVAVWRIHPPDRPMAEVASPDAVADVALHAYVAQLESQLLMLSERVVELERQVAASVLPPAPPVVIRRPAPMARR